MTRRTVKVQDLSHLISSAKNRDRNPFFKKGSDPFQGKYLAAVLNFGEQRVQGIA